MNRFQRLMYKEITLRLLVESEDILRRQGTWSYSVHLRLFYLKHMVMMIVLGIKLMERVRQEWIMLRADLLLMGN